MKNLLDYVMRVPALDEELCQNLITELDRKDWYDHPMYHHHKGKKVESEINQITHSKVVTLDGTRNDSLLIESLFNPIQKYVTELGKPFFNSWAGYTPIKYNKYEVGMSMAKHIDHIYSIFDNDYGVPKGIPTLSVLGVLNDDYEGGEMELFDDTKIKLNRGEVIIFPSVFMYPHKICEVTKGTRYSFGSWVY